MTWRQGGVLERGADQEEGVADEVHLKSRGAIADADFVPKGEVNRDHADTVDEHQHRDSVYT